MIIGLYTKDFSLLNKITNKINDKIIKLKHVKNLPIKDDDIKVETKNPEFSDWKNKKLQHTSNTT